MARIPEYEPNVDPISPLPGRSPERLFAEPQSFGSQVGEGLERLGASDQEATAAIYDAQQHQEVSDVMAQMAQKRAQWTAALDTRAASMKPGDQNFSSGFMNDVTNDLQTLGGNIGTRAGRQAFQRESAALTGDMLAASTRMQIASAGVKAKDDYLTTQNANAGTLFHDPSQFDSIMAQTKAAFADPSGPFSKMDPEARSNLEYQAQQTYAMAAARGIIRINPDLAKAEYNKGTLPGQSFLSEQSNYTILSEANQAVQAEAVQAERNIALSDKAEREQAQRTLNDLVVQAIKDPSSLTAQDIVNAPFGPQGGEMRMLMLEKMHSGFFDKPTLGMSTATGALAHDIITNQIQTDVQLMQHVGKDISFSEYNELRKFLNDSPTGKINNMVLGKFLGDVHWQLSRDSQTGIRDDNGEANFNRYVTAFLPRLNEALDRGVSIVSALNPDSKDYVGIPLSGFQRSDASTMSSLIAGYDGTAPSTPPPVAAAAAGAAPPPGAIEILKSRPDTAATFDKHFGAGAAERILGKK